MIITTRAEAVATGVKTYYPGRTCRNGHIGSPYDVHLGCKQCSRERIKDWEKRNPDKSNARYSRYHHKNKEKRNAESRQWYYDNVERAQATSRAWIEAHPERIKELNALWSRNNRARKRETHRAWIKAHPEDARVYLQSYRARKMDAPGSHTVQEVRDLLVIQDHKCANPYCCKDLREHKKCLDHIIALVNGGSDSIDNLQWLCRSCNCKKHDLDLEDWLERQRQEMDAA